MSEERQRTIVAIFETAEGGLAWRKIRLPDDEKRCGNRVFADLMECEDYGIGSFYTRIKLFDSEGRLIWDIPKHSVVLEYGDDE